MAQLGVQVVDVPKLLIIQRDLELDSPRVSDLFSTTIEFEGENVVFISEERLSDSFLSREALNDSLHLELEGLDRLLALRVVHVDVNLNFITWQERILVKSDD